MTLALDAVHAAAIPAESRETVDLWLHGRPATTTRTYSRDVADLFLTIEPRRLEAVTLRDLHGFDDAMQARYADDDGNPSAIARRKVCSVKSLFGFAHRAGLLDRNVSIALRVPKVRRRLAERILPEEDVVRAIAIADGRARYIVRLFYATGARCAELQRARWRDVRPIGGRGVVAILGKGGRERSVLVSAGTFADALRMRAGAGEDEFIFPGQDGEPISCRQIERIVKAAAVDAGLSSRVSPHWLRHAHATHALERGAPIHLVAATLGHASIETTAAYAHARPSDSSGLYLPV